MEIVFGPINSRRLGRSLGVSIVPKKTCSFDCIYCEAGKTNITTTQIKEYISAEKVISEFKEYYPKVMESLDVVTVTGLGEPTLNSALSVIADGLKKISEHPLCLLTNTSMLHIDSVKNAVKKFDIVIPSLDTVDENIFKAVNRPHNSVDLKHMIEALKEFSLEYNGKLYIELLLVKNVNDSKEALAKFVAIAKDIKYLQIQLHTVFRPPAYEGTLLLTEREMEDAYLFLVKSGLNVAPVGLFAMSRSGKRQVGSLSEVILSILALRPMTAKDLSLGLNIECQNVDAALSKLMDGGKVKSNLYSGENFYTVKK